MIRTSTGHTNPQIRQQDGQNGTPGVPVFAVSFRHHQNQPTDLKTLRSYRFELYLISFILILFGDLFFPEQIFKTWINPLLVLLALLSGYVILSVRKKTRPVFGLLFAVASIIELLQIIGVGQEVFAVKMTQYVIFTAFFTLVTGSIILQVWKTREVDAKLVFGVMGAYISLGLVAFFLLLAIEYAEPGSFRGIEAGAANSYEDLLYYTYITLMTIGYGDISPVNPLAKKASVLIGLWGQFYLVIITALVVGKYISYGQGDKKSH
jgi:hypothetical protein